MLAKQILALHSSLEFEISIYESIYIGKEQGLKIWRCRCSSCRDWINSVYCSFQCGFRICELGVVEKIFSVNQFLNSEFQQKIKVNTCLSIVAVSDKVKRARCQELSVLGGTLVNVSHPEQVSHPVLTES